MKPKAKARKASRRREPSVRSLPKPQPSIEECVAAATNAEDDFMDAPLYSPREVESFHEVSFKRGVAVGEANIAEAIHRDRVKQFLTDIESQNEITIPGVFSITVDTARAVVFELRQRGFRTS